MTDVELLTMRLQGLERSYRRLKRGVLVAGLLITAGTAVAQVIGDPPFILSQQRSSQKPPVEAEIRSQHFVLVDAKGRERASLVADGAGTGFLVMFDGAGKTRASLSVGNEGPSFILYDASGQQRTVIGSTRAVASHVNDGGIAEREPASSIVLFDKAGKLIWRQP
jgi:hypothetical protein